LLRAQTATAKGDNSPMSCRSLSQPSFMDALAPSVFSIQRPRRSFVPSAWTPGRSPVAHQALVPDFYPRRIEEDERIARLQTVIRAHTSARSGRRSREIGAGIERSAGDQKFLLGLEEPEYELRCLSDHPLARIAVSMVPPALGGRAIKMIVRSRRSKHVRPAPSSARPISRPN
jgi:hypothetical protein